MNNFFELPPTFVIRWPLHKDHSGNTKALKISKLWHGFRIFSILADLCHMTSEMWHMTCDKWHMTHDTWHRTHETWHRTHNTWHMTHDTWQLLIGVIKKGIKNKHFFFKNVCENNHMANSNYNFLYTVKPKIWEKNSFLHMKKIFSLLQENSQLFSFISCPKKTQNIFLLNKHLSFGSPGWKTVQP